MSVCQPTASASCDGPGGDGWHRCHRGCDQPFPPTLTAGGCRQRPFDDGFLVRACCSFPLPPVSPVTASGTCPAAARSGDVPLPHEDVGGFASAIVLRRRGTRRPVPFHGERDCRGGHVGVLSDERQPANVGCYSITNAVPTLQTIRVGNVSYLWHTEC